MPGPGKHPRPPGDSWGMGIPAAVAIVSGPQMNAPPAYARNQENFTAFHALQSEVALRLASNPWAIRRWLEAQPERQARKGGDSGKPPRAWRTARPHKKPWRGGAGQAKSPAFLEHPTIERRTGPESLARERKILWPSNRNR